MMMYQTHNCQIQAVMNNLEVHNFRLFAVWKSDIGLVQRFLHLVHKQSTLFGSYALQTS